MDEQMSNAANKVSTLQHRRGPMIASIAVAVFGVFAMLLVDHGPWNRSSAGNATMIEVGKTAGVAAAAGAIVTDTTMQPAPAASAPKSGRSAITD